jgi:hypothetical protein
MKRILFIVVGMVIGALATGAVLNAKAGAGGNPTTVAAGTVKATNNVTACSAFGGGGGGLCTVKLSGDYFDYGLLGNGKYSGTLTIDWSTYAVDPNFNSDMCASISGSMTYTTGSSVLKVKEIGASDFSQSFICESPYGQAPSRIYFFQGQVISGTGKFSLIIANTSSVNEDGQEFVQENGSGVPTGRYLDQPNIYYNLNFS